ncbi:GNAT family N-acetyltransferase [Yoonia litorea]|uniref:Protein N-acetyltransferase, RimJ/RimL family n=1 Tax=Yoonia litorea TaxID=1123755 RepID=A0A1I6L996_9RHOB|nr:GNAT family N-acetyltransferase [Yoonia litorea]SFR99974.1 Protein N-acetyltransferase, RimJ/RimL family [Yoonia litorea]
MIPTLQTQRLKLRPYQRRDFDAYAAFFASDQVTHMGGPIDAEKAWAWFTNDIASWALYGFGTLGVEYEGQFAGGVGLVHPPHFPEPECGWFVFDDFTGKGIAQEAGRAMLDHSFATTNLPSIVSYISAANTASIRVAEALGGTRDPDANGPDGFNALVYRHYRKGVSHD